MSHEHDTAASLITHPLQHCPRCGSDRLEAVVEARVRRGALPLPGMRSVLGHRARQRAPRSARHLLRLPGARTLHRDVRGRPPGAPGRRELIIAIGSRGSTIGTSSTGTSDSVRRPRTIRPCPAPRLRCHSTTTRSAWSSRAAWRRALGGIPTRASTRTSAGAVRSARRPNSSAHASVSSAGWSPKSGRSSGSNTCSATISNEGPCTRCRTRWRSAWLSPSPSTATSTRVIGRPVACGGTTAMGTSSDCTSSSVTWPAGDAPDGRPRAPTTTAAASRSRASDRMVLTASPDRQ